MYSSPASKSMDCCECHLNELCLALFDAYSPHEVLRWINVSLTVVAACLDEEPHRMARTWLDQGPGLPHLDRGPAHHSHAQPAHDDRHLDGKAGHLPTPASTHATTSPRAACLTTFSTTSRRPADASPRQCPVVAAHFCLRHARAAPGRSARNPTQRPISPSQKFEPPRHTRLAHRRRQHEQGQAHEADRARAAAPGLVAVSCPVPPSASGQPRLRGGVCGAKTRRRVDAGGGWGTHVQVLRRLSRRRG